MYHDALSKLIDLSIDAQLDARKCEGVHEVSENCIKHSNCEYFSRLQRQEAVEFGDKCVHYACIPWKLDLSA